MVEYADLKDADPKQWAAAANDWISLGKNALAAAQDVRHEKTGKVDKSWSAAVGKAAAKKLATLADSLESAYDIMRGVAMVIDGMAESIELAKATLQGALDLAASHQVQVDGTGTASSAAAPPTAPNGAADQHLADEQEYVGKVQGLIDEALRAANQADEKAAKALSRLQQDTAVTNPNKAVSEQNSASKTELSMYAGDIPSGKHPALVAAWWNSLSTKEQHDLEQAEPTALANLNGLPPDVRDRVRHGGTDGDYDRAKEVAYAQKYAMSRHGDLYDDTQPNEVGDCTTFVSQSLAAGDMRQTDAWSGDNTGNATIDRLGHGIGHTTNWSSAAASYQYWSQDHGTELPMSQAQPGDIVYFQDPTNGVHHAAVVTAVTPDGDLRFASHSNENQDKSLDSWLATNSGNTVHIVRPR